MADCEVILQHLYGLLGWDYRDEDSEVEENLQHKLPVMGSNSMGRDSASRHGADAEGDPECGKELGIPHLFTPQRWGRGGGLSSSCNLKQQSH